MIITESIATEKHHKKLKKKPIPPPPSLYTRGGGHFGKKNETMKNIYSMSRLIILGGSRLLITGSLDFISAYVLIISGS